MYDDVPSCGYLLPVAAHHLAHSSPHAVAHHRASQRLLDAEPEPAQSQFVGSTEYGEVGTRYALSPAIHGVECAAPHQAHFAGKRLALRGVAATTRA